MKAERAKELVQRFAEHKILVVGDVMLDHYVTGVVERLNPEAPVPILNAREERLMTGGAGNVAKNVAALGAKAILVSVVGDDKEALKIEEVAAKEGYMTRLLHDASRPTIKKARFLVRSQQLLRVDYEQVHDISTELETQLIKFVQEELAEGVDGAIISDYAKGVMTKKTIETIIKLAKSKKIPVAADVKPSRVAFVRGATLISPNIKEAHEFLGLNMHDRGGQQPAELAQRLHEKLGVEAFVTLSAEGMYVYADQEMSTHVRQEHRPEVYDPSGAGDTAIATLLLAKLSGANPVEAAQLGNAAGAVEVSKIGSVGVTAQEVLDMMAHRHL